MLFVLLRVVAWALCVHRMCIMCFPGVADSTLSHTMTQSKAQLINATTRQRNDSPTQRPIEATAHRSNHSSKQQFANSTDRPNGSLTRLINATGQQLSLIDSTDQRSDPSMQQLIDGATHQRNGSSKPWLTDSAHQRNNSPMQWPLNAMAHQHNNLPTQRPVNTTACRRNGSSIG